MQGVLVAVVPVLIAGFALLMDRFESRILTERVPSGTDADAPSGMQATDADASAVS